MAARALASGNVLKTEQSQGPPCVNPGYLPKVSIGKVSKVHIPLLNKGQRRARGYRKVHSWRPLEKTRDVDFFQMQKKMPEFVQMCSKQMQTVEHETEIPPRRFRPDRVCLVRRARRSAGADLPDLHLQWQRQLV